ncbi:unnamed protein product [Ranitomeya imitator]|uniref:Secreted protein n=1 Tax=Ranitomeya imitator TaxID=111125 RepID=A0ABN9LSE9_9NEOB|nr:unnamed protein product [Ranitomeya imitator]
MQLFLSALLLEGLISIVAVLRACHFFCAELQRFAPLHRDHTQRDTAESRRLNTSSGTGTPERSARPHSNTWSRTLRSGVSVPELVFNLQDSAVSRCSVTCDSGLRLSLRCNKYLQFCCGCGSEKRCSSGGGKCVGSDQGRTGHRALLANVTMASGNKVTSDEIMDDNTKTFSPLMVSGWVKPFIVKLLCFLFLNDNDNPKHPNYPDQKFTYPVDFDLISCTEVDTNGFE